MCSRPLSKASERRPEQNYFWGPFDSCHAVEKTEMEVKEFSVKGDTMSKSSALIVAGAILFLVADYTWLGRS
jgi:hypothetical protein